MKPHTKRMGIIALFSVLIFITKSFLPSPLNKMVIVVQAIMLALGAFIIGLFGATYISIISSILSGIWNPALALFTLFFGILYGILIDVTFYLLKVQIRKEHVNIRKTIIATTICTMFIGIGSYYSTTHLIPLLPRNLILEISILIIGTLNGAIAGYVASIIWNKYLNYLTTN